MPTTAMTGNGWLMRKTGIVTLSTAMLSECFIQFAESLPRDKPRARNAVKRNRDTDKRHKGKRSQFERDDFIAGMRLKQNVAGNHKPENEDDRSRDRKGAQCENDLLLSAKRETPCAF